MTKKILKIVQNDTGDINPKSNLFEQPVWVLELENGENRILGKVKMEEYLSKAYEKTIYLFKRWNISTTEGNSITAWCIIFTDKSHELVPTTKMKELIFHGHVRKDMEKYHNIDQEIRERHAKPENPALFHGEIRQSLTTDDEKEQLNKFRTDVISGIK